MGRIVVTEFITIDGVAGEPHEWSFPYWGEDIGEYKTAELFGGEALLLGRVTYGGFVEAWPDRDGDFADRMNGLPKYVVSSTVTEPTWNATVIAPDTAVVEALRKDHDGDIYVHGSLALVRWLLEHHLVDELRLLTYPLALGTGARLFADDAVVPLELIETTTFASGAIALIYRPLAERPAPVPHLYP